MASHDLETFLTREAAAAALTEAGFPTSPATLATKAVRGGGPPYRRFGPRVLYRWGDALAWARSKLGPVVTSSAELDAARQRGRVIGVSANDVAALAAAMASRFSQGSRDGCRLSLV